MRFLLLGICLGLAGCVRAPAAAPVAGPAPVTVSRPVERDVTDYADFSGRPAAVDSVEVRARVWGYLDKVNFKEGALVKKDDVLFEIDPRLYRADFSHALGRLRRDPVRHLPDAGVLLGGAPVHRPEGGQARPGTRARRGTRPDDPGWLGRLGAVHFPCE
jgi:multidrug efflux pump subunit AcrA (membrane-fusion protein)